MMTSSAKSAATEIVDDAAQALGLPPASRELTFHPTRKWRFDLAWPTRRLAVEVEGGTWSGGRHVRGKGYEGDIEKYNAAQALGWLVLRVTPQMLTRSESFWAALEWVIATRHVHGATAWQQLPDPTTALRPVPGTSMTSTVLKTRGRSRSG